MTSGTCFDEGKPLFMGSVAESLLTSGACFNEDESLFRGSVAGSLYTLCRQVCRTWDLSRGLSPGRRLLQENKSVGLGHETGPRSIPE